jgi:DNA-binding response OmpR family regulator
VSNQTVLVVEDDANMQDFLKEILASEGLIVHTASDGKEALQKTLSLTPDLVLLDLRMPNLDGVTYCKAVRVDKHTRNIPIIVVTSLSMQSKLEESIAAGADDFVAKPFDVNDLLLRVRSMLKVQHITDTQERMQRYILSLRQARGETPTKV